MKLDKVLDQAEEGYLIQCRDDDGNINIFAQNSYGDTLLHVAVGLHDHEAVGYLVDQGLDINATGEGMITPLCSAAMSTDVDMISLLLSLGADMTIPNCLQQRPADVFFESLKEKRSMCKRQTNHLAPSNKNPLDSEGDESGQIRQ